MRHPGWLEESQRLQLLGPGSSFGRSAAATREGREAPSQLIDPFECVVVASNPPPSQLALSGPVLDKKLNARLSALSWRRVSSRRRSTSGPESRHRLPIDFCRALALGLVVQLGGAVAAQATESSDDYLNPDRPGIADGSNVVGAGRIQVETGVQLEYRDRDGVHARSLYLPTLVRAGLNQDFELRIEGNTYTRVKATDLTGEPAKSQGVAPTSIGLKYHFIDALGPQQPSVGAIVRFFPRSGTGSFRTTRATGDFRIAADWDFLPQWSFNPNIGLALYEDDGGRHYLAGLLAATLTYTRSKSLSFFIDTGLQAPETRHGRAALVVDVGTAYLIGKDLQLDFSAGSRIAGNTPPRLFLSAGVSRRF